MKVLAVIFPQDFPEEDRRLLFDALSRENPPAIVINKCYIFGPEEYDCFIQNPILGWGGNAPAILVQP